MIIQWVAAHVRKIGVYITTILVGGFVISATAGFYFHGIGGSVLGIVFFVSLALTVWMQLDALLDVALPLAAALTFFLLIGASIYFLWNVR
jgi:hypothetical protein